MTDEELKALKEKWDRYGVAHNAPARIDVLALIADLEEARRKLMNRPDAHLAYLRGAEAGRADRQEARALAFEEAARLMDALVDPPWTAKDIGNRIRALATLPPALVAVEKETVEKVRVALQVGMAGLSGEAGEFIREAFGLLEEP